MSETKEDIKEEVTEIQEIDVNLKELLGTGTGDIMTANEPKRTIFSDISPDTSFLNEKTEPAAPDTKKDEGDTDDGKEEDGKDDAKAEADNKDDVLAPPSDAPAEEDDQKNKGGRPTSISSIAKKLVEGKVLLPFDDEKKIEDYNAEDFQELIESNVTHMRETLSKEIPEQFFQSLPEEMQEAYNYIANGGTDVKGIFNSIAAKAEVRELDITQEADQKYAIRAYLQATQYGTPEEIEDEIKSFEDRNELEKKAKQFKPKLDALQQSIVNQRLAAQESSAKERHEQSQKYIESIYSTLEKGKLNGLDLDNKTQNMLYAGLVQSNYPSATGGQTNMLGHLLEQHQWIEPRHDLIAEALWLLADPDGYRSSVGRRVEKDVNEKTLRTLKTEQSNKSGGSTETEDEQDAGSARKSGLARPKRNFFTRKD